MPGKIRFIPLSPVPDGQIESNIRNSRSLGLPKVGEIAAKPLAVVGGGPSVAGYLDELKSFPGDIWAINGTYRWLKSNGIDCWFYTVDPSDLIADMCRDADKAILGDTCHPNVFRALSDRDVRIVWLGEGGVSMNCTSASNAPLIAAYMGYSSVVFYGCEGSFEASTHVDRNESTDLSRIRVVCDDDVYMTRPDMMMGVVVLSEMIRELPSYMSVRGNGLLDGLVRCKDWTVTHVSRDVMEAMQ